MNRKKTLLAAALALALATSIWTLAVTFTPIVADFQAGDELSATTFNDLFDAIQGNFSAAETAIEDNESRIATLEASGGLTFPFEATVDLDETAFIVANEGNGSAGAFTATDPAGLFPALNVASANPNAATLLVTNNGGGSAGFFDGSVSVSGGGLSVIRNTSDDGTALNGFTNGTGTGLRVTHNGASGNIAEFRSDADTKVSISKTGNGMFQGGVNASSSNNTIPAVFAFHNGDGRAGSFTANGFGSAVAGINTDTGRAGDFQIQNAASGNIALFAATTGTGNAGNFQSDNTNNATLFVNQLAENGLALQVNGATNMFGSLFVGDDLNVTGTKNFRIDHPLAPTEMYLTHFAVESDEVSNVYTGNIELDETGAAWVDLPDWFEALNGDVRYQLTAVGAPAPGLHVAEEVAGNRFAIAGGESGMKVSWQLTALRDDPAIRHRATPVEQRKPAAEQGTYLSPEAYGMSPELGLEALLHTAESP